MDEERNKPMVRRYRTSSRAAGVHVDHRSGHRSPAGSEAAGDRNRFEVSPNLFKYGSVCNL